MNKVIKGDFIVFMIFFIVFILINAILLGTGSLKWGADGVGIMVAAALTIGLYSFLWKDNPLFKMAEHLYVGLASAYMLVVQWYSVLLPDVIMATKRASEGAFSVDMIFKYTAIFLPVTLGLLIYTRLFPKIAWMSRYTFAALIGFGAGSAMPSYVQGFILEQLKPTMVSIWGPVGLEWDVIVIFLGLITTLVYFFFSVEHKGFIGYVARVGIWFLMISFGASFGYTVMARISLLIGRVTFLFQSWIPLIN